MYSKNMQWSLSFFYNAKWRLYYNFISRSSGWWYLTIYYSSTYKYFIDIHNKYSYTFYKKYHLKWTITNMVAVLKIYATSYIFKVDSELHSVWAGRYYSELSNWYIWVIRNHETPRYMCWTKPTPFSLVLETLILTRLVNKFPVLLGTRRFLSCLQTLPRTSP
jgi:hypothetical protein